jgi:hypothetical protein
MYLIARRRLLTFVAGLSAIACAPLIGCVAQPNTTNPSNAMPPTNSTASQGDLVGRVIVKFKDRTVQADAASVLRELERDCQARVTYARALGADAHLYELNGLSDQAALEQAAKKLAARPDVEFAEIDRLMKPMQRQ